MIRRRALLGGLLALAAPAIVRTPGLLMPVKRLPADDGVALLSASHPPGSILALQNELDALREEWGRVAYGFPVVGPQLPEAMTASQTMAAMKRMRDLEVLIAERFGNTAIAEAAQGQVERRDRRQFFLDAPVLEPARAWDPRWWSDHARKVGA